ncbi:MAG: NADPH-dependent oxidoreductase [Candidatus Marinimicrobia bacterium]|nr:NADPH-dependent oxidoreductase [Candidatus Neomarinimicrobiota bacterium]
METSSTLNVQSQHVTIRSFTNEDIPEKVLSNILEAGRRAPTSSNMQAYSVIVVKDPAVKKELAVLAGNQKQIETCPVFLAFCADLHRLNKVCELHDVEMTNNLETFLVSTIDASLVGMSVQTGAESMGLGAVMIGAMRNHPGDVARLLGLPPHVYVTYGMCLGWPVKQNIPPQKPRLPKDIVIHNEQYNQTDPTDKIKSHDDELAQHYLALGKNLHSAAWSGVIARSLSGTMRPENLNILTGLGFNICQKP